MKRAVVENVCITAGLLGLCIFFEMRNNREALMMSLAALLALWKHSGRRRPDASPGTALPIVLVLSLLGLGCKGTSTWELGLPRPASGPVCVEARAAVAPLASGVNADYVRLTGQGSNPVGVGYAGIYADSGDGSLRFIDAAGNSIKAGTAKALLQSAGTPGSAVLGDCWVDTTDSYKLYCKESGGVVAQRSTAAGLFGSSVTANYVVASPDGSSGAVSPRALVAADIPALAASKITTGTLALARGGLAADLSGVAANRVLASPDGSSGNVTARALAAADIPSLAASKITTGQLALARGGTGLDLSSASQNQCFCGPVSGGAGNALLRALDGADITAGQVGQARGGTGGDLSSSAANRVWASPNGSSGAMAVRALVAADLPATAVTPGSYTAADITVDAQGRITAASNGSGGGAAFSFSPVDLYTVGADYLGDYTTGGRFLATAAVSITGVRFTRFVNSATMTVKLWKGGVAQATASQAVTTGVYSVTFGTPVSLVAGEEFYVTTYDGGTRYAKNNSAPSFDPSWSTGLIIPFGAKVALLAPSYYAAGDAQPTTSGGERFPVEPIY